MEIYQFCHVNFTLAIAILSVILLHMKYISALHFSSNILKYAVMMFKNKLSLKVFKSMQKPF